MNSQRLTKISLRLFIVSIAITALVGISAIAIPVRQLGLRDAEFCSRRLHRRREHLRTGLRRLPLAAAIEFLPTAGLVLTGISARSCWSAFGRFRPAELPLGLLEVLLEDGLVLAVFRHRVWRTFRCCSWRTWRACIAGRTWWRIN